MNVLEVLQWSMASLHYVVVAVLVGAGLFGSAVFLYQLSIDMRRQLGKRHSTSSVYGSVLDE